MNKNDVVRFVSRTVATISVLYIFWTRYFYTTVGTLSVVYFLLKVRLSYWKRRGILHEKPKFVWGNLEGIGKKRHLSEALQVLYEKYKGKAPFIGFYAYLKPMVLVLDLDTISHILKEDASYFVDRGLYHNKRREPLSGNLMQLDGAEWDQLRKKLSPVLMADKIHLALQALLKVAENFERSFQVQQEQQQLQEVSINTLVNAYNLDVVASLVYGLEYNSLENLNDQFSYESTLHSMASSYSTNCSLLRAYLVFQFPILARLLQQRSYADVACEYFEQLSADQLKRSHTQQREHIYFLSVFADLSLDSKEIAAQSFSFVLCGLAPANATLTFCLYELALQPELQERARREIDQVLDQHHDNVNMKSLDEMQYLKMVLYETIRKHSPYPCLLRRTIKDYELRNSVFMLRESNHVIIPIAAIHNDPTLYPDPEKFDPNRFQPAAIEQRHPMSFLPFGLGPRDCLGRRFVELQLLVALVTLLRRYKFSPCSKTPSPPLQYDSKKLILSPLDDVKLLVERIEFEV